MIEEILAFSSWAMRYVGGALAWTALVGIPLGILLRMRHPQAVPLLLATLFTLFLTLTPLPDPTAVDCKPIVLQPFEGLGTILYKLWYRNELWRLLTDLIFVSSVMNVVFFMPVGAALLPFLRRSRMAAACGLGLSLTIEFTQLTGLFGYYECAYRHADVSDLMTNTLGVWLGFVVARGIAAVWTARTRRGRS